MSADSIEDIRGQMARIRSRAVRKATRLGEETRQFLDWKHYVRLFPWGSLAVAAAVGYFLVPRRIVVKHPDAKALAELMKNHQLVVASHAPPEKKGLVGSLMAIAGSMMMKAGMAYASQYATKFAAGLAAPRMPEGERAHDYADYRP